VVCLSSCCGALILRCLWQELGKKISICFNIFCIHFHGCGSHKVHLNWHMLCVGTTYLLDMHIWYL